MVRQDFILKVIWLFIWAISAIRYDVGTDFQTYSNIYIYTSWDSFKPILEPGHQVLILLLKFLWNQSLIYFATTSGIICFAFYHLIKQNSKNYILSSLVAIFLGSYLYSLNTIQQFLSYSIILYSLKRNENWLNNRKILLASLFHLQSILLIPINFLAKQIIHIRKSIIIVTLLTSNLLGLIWNPGKAAAIILERLDLLNFYLETDYLLYKSPTAYLKTILPTWLAFKIINSNEVLNKKTSTFVIFVILNNVFNGITLFSRFNYFLDLLLIIYSVNILDRFSRNGSRSLYYILLFCYAAFSFYFHFIQQNGIGIFPFKTIFNPS